MKKKLSTFVEKSKIEVFLKKVSIIFNCKLAFNYPKKSKILFYDPYVSNIYFDIFRNLRFETLDTRLKLIYLKIAFKAVFQKFKNTHLTLKENYIIEFIKENNPNHIISFTNVDLFFWTLKKYFPHKKFYLFQASSINGWGQNQFERYKQKYDKKNQIDYVFPWGKGLFKKYKSVLNCNLSATGSLLNNSIPNVNLNKNKKYIIFLSQYKKQSSLIRTNENKVVDQNLTYHDQRKHILKIVNEFCYKNKFELKIFPRSFKKKEWEDEKKYYSNMFNNIDLKLIKRNKKKQIYNCLAKYQNFVVIDSSAGYEALARGKRVCFLNIKKSFSNYYDSGDHRYGWPLKFSKNKNFWSSCYKKKSIERALNFAFFSSKLKWKKVKKKYIDPVIIFDPLNKKLFRNLKKIGFNL
jgi:surface carbohydrate biosynthesis protein